MAWTSLERVTGFDFTDVIYERKYRDRGGGVAGITINRAEKLNAGARRSST